MDKQGTPGRKKSRSEDTNDGDDTSNISAGFTRHQGITLIQQMVQPDGKRFPAKPNHFEGIEKLRLELKTIKVSKNSPKSIPDQMADTRQILANYLVNQIANYMHGTKMLLHPF